MKKTRVYILKFTNAGLTVRSLGLPFSFQDIDPIVSLKTVVEQKRKPRRVVYNR